MLATSHGNQFGLIAGRSQLVRQPHALFVRNRRIRIAMNAQDRRQTFSHKINRRQFFRQIHSSRLFGNPGHRILLPMRSVQLIRHIGNAVEIDYGGDLDRRSKTG